MIRSSWLGIRPSLSLVCLCCLLIVLWIAGGSVRADAAGQFVVRGAAAGALIAVLLFGPRPNFAETRSLWLLLAAAVLLVGLQLVPLPPGVWQTLPGRKMFAEAAVISGQPQPWRPWSLVPSGTFNAAASLIVPVATLGLLCGLRPNERSWLPGILLGLVVTSMFLGLLQFAGVRFDNPLINDTPGAISGSFANRNHFALFIAMGCLLIPAWMFQERYRGKWRLPVGLGLALLFALMILATGSRAGMVLGALALAIGAVLARQGLVRSFAKAPRWVIPALAGGLLALLTILVLISVAADRAVSIQRIFSIDTGQDMRGLALPTMLEMAKTYFPFGAGIGTFDPVFRLHEPFTLLKPTYFNHAHDDLLEILLDAGVPGVLLLLAAIVWLVRASISAWRSNGTSRQMTPRVGSAMLILIVIASAFDYPARTPMMMAVIMIAGACLCWRTPASER